MRCAKHRLYTSEKENKIIQWKEGKVNMYSIERPLEPPDFPAPDCICQECDGWFYGDDVMYISNGRRLCPDCFREEISDLSTEELAELIGAEVMNAEDAREVHKPYGRMRYRLR